MEVGTWVWVVRRRARCARHFTLGIWHDLRALTKTSKPRVPDRKYDRISRMPRPAGSGVRPGGAMHSTRIVALSLMDINRPARQRSSSGWELAGRGWKEGPQSRRAWRLQLAMNKNAFTGLGCTLVTRLRSPFSLLSPLSLRRREGGGAGGSAHAAHPD